MAFLEYKQDLPLEGLTPEQYLAAATEAAQILKWNIKYLIKNELAAYSEDYASEVTVKTQTKKTVLKSRTEEGFFYDSGSNKKHIQSLAEAIDEVKSRFTPEELDQKYALLKHDFALEETNASASPSTKEKISELFSIFRPKAGYFVTPILINLNILIFILMVLFGVDFISPDAESMVRWGANFRPFTVDGEWWRLITSCFLHIGVLHLLMNMYALLYIGLLLEPYLGKVRFLAAYVFAGIAASMTSICWHGATASAGASGAIFGMYGVFLTMLTTDIVRKSTRKSLLASIAVFLSYNLLTGLRGGIDNAAHLGGLISGILIGYIYVPSLRKTTTSGLRPIVVGLAAALVTLPSVIVYKILVRNAEQTKRTFEQNIAKYNREMERFISMESMALEFYRMPRRTPKEELLYNIDDRGIYYWNENMKLIRELDSLDLPPELHERNKRIIRYCQWRIKSYRLIYKAVEQETNTYNDSIDFYNREIGLVTDSLKQQ